MAAPTVSAVYQLVLGTDTSVLPGGTATYDIVNKKMVASALSFVFGGGGNTVNNRLVYSHDDGQTWTEGPHQTDDGLWIHRITSPSTNAIYIANQGPQTTDGVYQTVGKAGIAKSLDGGLTWQQVWNPSQIDPANYDSWECDGVLQCAGTRMIGYGKMWSTIGGVDGSYLMLVSNDNGATFHVFDPGLTHVSDAFAGIYLGAGRILLGAYFYPYFASSSDNGDHWSEVLIPGGSSPRLGSGTNFINDIATDGHGNVLAFGSLGVYLSTNNGVTFTDKTTAFKTAVGYDTPSSWGLAPVYCRIWDSTHWLLIFNMTGLIVSSTWRPMYYTEDGGVTYTPLSPPIVGVQVCDSLDFGPPGIASDGATLIQFSAAAGCCMAAFGSGIFRIPWPGVDVPLSPGGPILPAPGREEVSVSSSTSTRGTLVSAGCPTTYPLGGGAIVLLEADGYLTDACNCIPFEIETPGYQVDSATEGVLQRVYVEANTNGQVLQPILVLDAGDLVSLPPFVTTKRQTVEWSQDRSVNIVGLRITGCVRAPVEIFGIEFDVYEPLVPIIEPVYTARQVSTEERK